jgi:hypothetical protein
MKLKPYGGSLMKYFIIFAIAAASFSSVYAQDATSSNDGPYIYPIVNTVHNYFTAKDGDYYQEASPATEGEYAYGKTWSGSPASCRVKYTLDGCTYELKYPGESFDTDCDSGKTPMSLSSFLTLSKIQNEFIPLCKKVEAL